MSTFVLKIQDIDESGRDWSFQIDPGWLAAALQGSDLHAGEGPGGTLGVRANRSGLDIVVTDRVQSEVFARCSRCLGDVSLRLDIEATTLFTPGGPSEEREVSLEPDDIDTETYSGPEIILDELVRQQILLENPMQPLCSETCEGIALPEYVSGLAAGMAVDRRLAPLLKIKEALASKVGLTEDQGQEE